MEMKVKKLSPSATVPSYSHPNDAGMDLFSASDCVIGPGEVCLVPTGVAIELPEGTEAQVRPKSGIALKHCVTVLNTPGTIDEGYRGEVGVILVNHGSLNFEVKVGDKIAQLVVKPVLRVDIVIADILSNTSRGVGGFGSTGVRSDNEDA